MVQGSAEQPVQLQSAWSQQPTLNFYHLDKQFISQDNSKQESLSTKVSTLL